MTIEKKNNPLALSAPYPWLTVNVALGGLLLFIALGLRLFRLEATPLNGAEAQGALAAWRFAQGQTVSLDVDYSPVLFSAQWFTFLIFGSSDLLARLLPTLAGTALVLTPALLRRHIGQGGALIAGALLALSPTALTLSRTASGDVLVALAALLCVGGIWRYVTSRRVGESASQLSRSLFLVAFGLALTLVSSPLAYSALISLAGAFALLIFIHPASRAQLQEAWLAFRATPNATTCVLGILLGSALLFSTAFAWHLGGLAEAASLLPRWLDGFVRWPDSLSLNYPVFILLVYEPLLLFLGVVGGALAFLRLGEGKEIEPRDTALRFLALWGGIAAALALIRPGHGPGDVLLILTPLACLGGLALDVLIQALRRWGHWLNEGAYLLISAPLWAFLLINLATYSRRPGQYTSIDLPLINASLPTHLSTALATVLVFMVLVTILSLVQGAGPTLRGLGLSITLALLLFTVAAAWGVTQNRPSDPREPLVVEPTAPELRLLRDTLARVSNEHQGDDHAIDVTVLTNDPALAWVLRNFQKARFVDTIDGKTGLSPALITPQALTPSQLGQGYVGQSFPLRKRWNTNSLACQSHQVMLRNDLVRQLDCGALVKWLVFRLSPDQPDEERVVLWLRQDLINQ